MKKKLIVILLVIVLACSSAFALISCKKDKDKDTDKDQTGGTKVNITILPDMVDYGAPSYYEVNAVNYDDKLETEWINELTEKRSDEREYWIDDVSLWNNSEYYTFGPVAKAYGESEEKRQSNIGYFDADGNWVTDESANTVERIFCYSEPADIINRFSLAAIDSVKTDGIIKYIARDDADPDRPKGTGYSYTIGVDSAIEDYAQLEELQEIYDDFDAYKDDSSYAEPRFKSEDDVYDALSLKQRKVYGEIFTIFGDDAAQFARAAIAMSAYAIKVVESVMLPAYENYKDHGEIPGDNDFIEYMRNEVYDYDTLSYMLAFREYTGLDAEYKVTQKTDAMSLFGYHYQYKHRDYGVFDDSVKKNYEGKEITEYEYFLKLSHKSYFISEQEALDYRDYDRRQYEQAYRYSAACYKKYYEKQLNFQALQEENEVTLYYGGHNNRFPEGIGYYNGSTSATGSGVTTYTKEMQEALSLGFEATLKLSDVNWEYTGVDNNVLRYNSANTNWNKLTDEQQKVPSNKILNVRLELEQLKSQDYSINHATITNADLTQALKYQIKSYSADSIRGIQANKKDEVLYRKDIDRFFQALNENNSVIITEEKFESSTSTPIYQRNAYESLKEDLGRNYAKYQNLYSNYSYSNVTDQIETADGADWPGVKSNIKETLAVDYEAYDKNTVNSSAMNVIYVDEYFEDTLIRKTYTCEGTDDYCPYTGNSGHTPRCEKEYDTNWALSRLIDSHEVVLRYMYGQIEVTFYMINARDIKEAGTFDTPKKEGVTAGTSAEAKADDWYKIGSYATFATDNVMSDEAIGTVCKDSSNNWAQMPNYDGDSDITYSKAGNASTLTIKKGSTTYRYTFIGWYVDENFQYLIDSEEEIDYDIRLYPGYRMEIIS